MATMPRFTKRSSSVKGDTKTVSSGKLPSGTAARGGGKAASGTSTVKAAKKR